MGAIILASFLQLHMCLVYKLKVNQKKQTTHYLILCSIFYYLGVTFLTLKDTF